MVEQQFESNRVAKSDIGQARANRVMRERIQLQSSFVGQSDRYRIPRFAWIEPSVVVVIQDGANAVVAGRNEWDVEAARGVCRGNVCYGRVAHRSCFDECSGSWVAGQPVEDSSGDSRLWNVRSSRENNNRASVANVASQVAHAGQHGNRVGSVGAPPATWTHRYLLPVPVNFRRPSTRGNEKQSLQRRNA